MKKIVIMPGGFHPFHAGHASLYKDAVKAFPDADVYVAATNDTSSRPFPFAVKEKLAQLAGVAPGRFVQVKSPFGAEEITSKYDPNTTNLIFVKSTKNAKGGPSPEGPFPAEIDPATGKLPLVKRGANKGKPVSDRLQYYQKGMKMQPMSRHSYLAYFPTVEFLPGMTGASDIRAEWPTLDQQGKLDRVMSLYPKTQTNSRLAQTVVKMLDTAIGGLGEAINNQMNVGGLIASYQAKDNQPINEQPQGTVEAYGYVYNNRDQRVVWRKIFSSESAATTWANSKNATVLGMKNIQQPANEDYVEERRS
jgi:hypothetical protein